MAANKLNWRGRDPGCALALILSTLMLLGCTYNIKIPITPVVQYPERKVLNLTVELYLTPEFSEFSRVSQLGGYTYNFHYPAGMFTASAEALARACFQQVVVSKGPSTDPSGSSAYRLTPRVILMESETDGGFDRMHLMLEWTLTDRQGKIFWKHTVLGSSAVTGRGTTQSAIDAAFLASRDQILDSAALVSLVGRR